MSTCMSINTKFFVRMIFFFKKKQTSLIILLVASSYTSKANLAAALKPTEIMNTHPDIVMLRSNKANTQNIVNHAHIKSDLIKEFDT